MSIVEAVWKPEDVEAPAQVPEPASEPTSVQPNGTRAEGTPAVDSNNGPANGESSQADGKVKAPEAAPPAKA